MRPICVQCKADKHEGIIMSVDKVVDIVLLFLIIMI